MLKLYIYIKQICYANTGNHKPPSEIILSKCDHYNHPTNWFQILKSGKPECNMVVTYVPEGYVTVDCE